MKLRSAFFAAADEIIVQGDVLSLRRVLVDCNSLHRQKNNHKILLLYMRYRTD